MEYFCPLCGAKTNGTSEKKEIENDTGVTTITKLYIDCEKCNIRFSMRLYPLR